MAFGELLSFCDVKLDSLLFDASIGILLLSFMIICTIAPRLFHLTDNTASSTHTCSVHVLYFCPSSRLHMLIFSLFVLSFSNP